MTMPSPRAAVAPYRRWPSPRGPIGGRRRPSCKLARLTAICDAIRIRTFPSSRTNATSRRLSLPLARRRRSSRVPSAHGVDPARLGRVLPAESAGCTRRPGRGSRSCYRSTRHRLRLHCAPCLGQVVGGGLVLHGLYRPRTEHPLVGQCAHQGGKALGIQRTFGGPNAICRLSRGGHAYDLSPRGHHRWLRVRGGDRGMGPGGSPVA
jgi:hypothetical protein